ncbi:DUF5131 family protein [Streptomyces sp. NPDC002755]
MFVNSMSDLFHARVPLDFVRQVFQVMADTPQYTYQVLIKRARRLRQVAVKRDWPANVWMGVSVESAKELARINDLRRVPAAVRFLSCEPLLGPLDGLDVSIDWVIADGEPGPRFRPVKEEWVTGIRDVCTDAGVAFFFKLPCTKRGASSSSGICACLWGLRVSIRGGHRDVGRRVDWLSCHPGSNEGVISPGVWSSVRRASLRSSAVVASAVGDGVDAGLQSLQDRKALPFETVAQNESTNAVIKVSSCACEPAQLGGVTVTCCGVEPELSLHQVIEPLALVLLPQDRGSVSLCELGPQVRSAEKVPKCSVVGRGALVPAPLTVLATGLSPLRECSPEQRGQRSEQCANQPDDRRRHRGTSQSAPSTCCTSGSFSQAHSRNRRHHLNGAS